MEINFRSLILVFEYIICMMWGVLVGNLKGNLGYANIFLTGILALLIIYVIWGVNGTVRKK